MQADLKTNLSRALELPEMRHEISLYIEESDLDILVNLARVILDTDPSRGDIEPDLGSELTERLLDAVRHSSWERLHPIYEGLNR